MEQFFTSLSKRQTMFLLTSLAFGGSEAVQAYEYLEESEEELLKHRAAGITQIPREKRVPLLVQEIKRLVTQRRRQLASADPKRLAALLSKERPTMAEVVLNALPAELAAAVRAELGNPPQLKLLRDVKPDVLSVVRWKLEDALSAGAPQVGSFRFTDLLTVQQRDVLAVADRMGARVLATAIAGLSDEERAGLLGKLPPDQRALAARAAEAGAARRLTEKDARLVLEMHGALENPSLGMRSAGAQRIVRACVAQSLDFAQAFAQRHQGDLGKLLTRWLKEEKGRPVKGDGGRLDIVEQLERLAQKGIVDRPMRLPPPVLAPAPAPQLKPPPGVPPGGPGPRASQVLVSPPQRRPSGGAAAPERPPSSPEVPPRPGGAATAARRPAPEGRPSVKPAAAGTQARRDPIADREARRAGAAGAVPRSGSPPRSTDSGLRAQRVLRDGKPLATEASTTRPSGRPAVARSGNNPREAGGEAGRDTNPHRPRVLKGSGRGPQGGSR